MYLFAFKLLIAPFLIVMVTLAARKWGHGVSGWFTGFPLTSAPVSLIFALQDGVDFAQHAAVGTLAGLASVSVFSVSYALLAPHSRWYIATPVSLLAFFITTAVLNQLPLPLVPTFVCVIAVILVSIQLVPARTRAKSDVEPPKWDLGVRIIAATIFIILITTVSNIIGPQLSGLLSPFPIFATVLSVFAHRLHGADAAIHFLHGLLLGLLAFASFFFMVGALVTNPPLLMAYAVGLFAALSVNAVSLRFAR